MTRPPVPNGSTVSLLSNRPDTPDWQLRVTDRDGTALHGAAVLVAPEYALTCAHVVVEAVGPSAGPGSEVRLDAPRGLPGWESVGTVLADGWWWEGEAPWDAAVLRLDRTAPGPPAATARHRVGDRVRVLGFPNAETGRWVTGRITGDSGSRFGYTQIDVDSATGFAVLPGFSGSGVREGTGDGLLGIVCEAAANGRAGWMIPLDRVPRVWGAGPDTATAVARTARAMTDLRTLLSPDLRFDLYTALDPRLRRRLRADQDLTVFASQLVSLAHEEYRLLGAVLDLLDEREEGSAGMLRVREAAAPLLTGRDG
ncbi:serine protease [Nocardiopsis sp. NPDC006198]|uniref:trypsin-like serine peptidase n=1 Tax=Nocardiopsis sp. NPDC006198 TaxID=3154472 RepID=UPI0033B31A21